MQQNNLWPKGWVELQLPPEIVHHKKLFWAWCSSTGYLSVMMDQRKIKLDQKKIKCNLLRGTT